MGQLFLQNGRLFDGTGAPPLERAGILVDGERLKWVGPMSQAPRLPPDGIETLDLSGRFVLPGLIEAHLHLSYVGVKELNDLDLKCPVEETTIEAALNARTALECGYTAAASAGAIHRIDIALRDKIKAGRIPGPRLLAGGRDICATASLPDWNPSYWRLGMGGLALIADGVEEVRKAARQCIKEGADILKCFITGEGMMFSCPAEALTYSLEEVAVVAEEAHRRNLLAAAHVRSAEGTKIAVRAGIDIIDHGTLMDDEAIEMCAAKKVFVVPAINYQVSILERGKEFGFPRDFLDATLYRQEIEKAAEVMKKLRKAGVRVLPGGDYGFVWCPHGEYARDLEHFVKLFGFSESGALVAATKWGSQMLRMEKDLGTLEAGKLADLVVVDGDPLKDIRVLQDRGRLALVLQGGRTVVRREMGRRPAPA